MPRKLTVIIAAREARGSTEKYGPRTSSTRSKMTDEIIDVTCVWPPLACCKADRDSEAAAGMAPKRPPTAQVSVFDNYVPLSTYHAKLST